MKADTAYVLFECECHPSVSIRAPSRDGDRHSIGFPVWNHPERDVTHQLVAKGGKWEIVE